MPMKVKEKSLFQQLETVILPPTALCLTVFKVKPKPNKWLFKEKAQTLQLEDALVSENVKSLLYL